MFAKFLTATLVALPFFAQSALAADCTRSYTVKAGDICDSISMANNVSTYQLAAINPAIDSTCSNLMPGASLCLGTSGEDCTTTYVIVADDTCDQIASNFKINSTILSMNNPQINQDCSNIYIGEVLCTGSQVQVPPAPAGRPPPVTSIPSTAKPANPPPTADPSTTTPPSNNSDDENDDDLPFCDEL